MEHFKNRFFGDGPWAHNSLDLLVKDKGIDFIYLR